LRVDEGDAHPWTARYVDGKDLVELDAVDLARGIPLGARAEHDQGAPIDRELHRARHARHHDLEPLRERGLLPERRREQEAGNEDRARARPPHAPHRPRSITRAADVSRAGGPTTLSRRRASG